MTELNIPKDIGQVQSSKTKKIILRDSGSDDKRSPILLNKETPSSPITVAPNYIFGTTAFFVAGLLLYYILKKIGIPLYIEPGETYWVSYGYADYQTDGSGSTLVAYAAIVTSIAFSWLVSHKIPAIGKRVSSIEKKNVIKAYGFLFASAVTVLINCFYYIAIEASRDLQSYVNLSQVMLLGILYYKTSVFCIEKENIYIKLSNYDNTTIEIYEFFESFAKKYPGDFNLSVSNGLTFLSYKDGILHIGVNNIDPPYKFDDFATIAKEKLYNCEEIIIKKNHTYVSRLYS